MTDTQPHPNFLLRLLLQPWRFMSFPILPLTLSGGVTYIHYTAITLLPSILAADLPLAFPYIKFHIIARTAVV